MNTYVQKPNSGTMFLTKSKKNDKAPDFYGSIHIDKDLLIELVKNRTSELIEVKLDAWKGTTKNGDPWLSLKINTWQPTQQKQEEKDPWL